MLQKYEKIRSFRHIYQEVLSPVMRDSWLAQYTDSLQRHPRVLEPWQSTEHSDQSSWHAGVGRGEQAQLVFFTFTEQMLPVGHLFWKLFNLALLYLNSLPPPQVPPLSQGHSLVERRTCKPKCLLVFCPSLVFSVALPIPSRGLV